MPRPRYLVSEKNQKFLDGSSRTTVSLRQALLGLFVCLGLFACGGVLARSAITDFQSHRAWRQLREDGVEIKARVLDLWLARNPLSSLFYVKYEFQATTGHEGLRFRRIGAANLKTHSHLRVGGDVLVVYSGANPNVSRISSGRTPAARASHFQWMYVIKGIIAVGLITLTSIPLVALGLSTVDKLRLARRGHIVTGEVTSCTEPQSLEGTVQFELTYRFRTNLGKEVEGKQQIRFSDSESRTPPVAGTEIVVLCVDEKRHELL